MTAPFADTKLVTLSGFTRTMVSLRGKPTPDKLAAFLAAVYLDNNVLKIILAIALKTISNYSNHLLHKQLDAMFAADA